jgi:O-antigen ligase
MAVSRPSSRLAALRTPQVMVSVGMIVLAVLAALGAIALAGTKTGLALAILAVAGPIALYASLVAPSLFPFMLYLVLVPFGNLLNLDSYGTVTKLLAIASGVAMMFWLVRTRRYIAPDQGVLWWLGFVLWATTTMLWAIDPQYGLPHLATLVELFLLYAVVSFMPVDRRFLVAFIATIVIGGALSGAYGIYLFHGGIDVSKDGRLFMANDNTIIDPNHFAAALILPFALALNIAVATRRVLVRVVSIASLALIVGGLLIAGSRGGLLAVVATFAYLCFRSRHRLILAFMGLIALGTGLSAYGNVLYRFSYAVSSGGAGRTAIWKVGLAALKAHPIFGVGYANFPYAYDRAFFNVYESYYAKWFRDPHDIFVQTSVELGLLGFILLVVVVWKTMRGTRNIPKDHPLFYLRTAAESAYIGLAVASIFLDVLEYKYLWLLFMTTSIVRNAALTQGEPRSERVVSAVLPSRSDA